MSARALIIGLNFLPDPGGIAKYLGKICEHMPPEKFHVFALDRDTAPTYDKQQPFKIHRGTLKDQLPTAMYSMLVKTIGSYTQQMFWWLQFYPRFLRLCKQEKTNVIVCGHIAVGLVSWLLAKKLKCKFVIVTYGNEITGPVERNQPIEYWFCKFLLNQADAIVSISNFTTDAVLQWGVSPEKIHKIHPGVDPKIFHPNISTANIIEKHNLKESHVILTVARLVERKGHDMIIQGMPKILADVPNTKYLIIGTGRFQDSLKQLAEDIGVADHIIFAGYIKDEMLPNYYCASDVFVMPSRQMVGSVEGFGIVYLEANACGKPVIAGRSGGSLDAIVDGETGLFVDSTNIDDIANAIIRILRDKSYANILGQKGRQHVETKLSWAISAQKFIEVIERL
ncbi:MAG: glycosyltransferase family 4 protein [Chloroflexota bacterium]